jgi:hypothetical protein
VNVFFDVDWTLIDGDGALRPGVVECFTELRRAGHHIYVWSGLGTRWEVVREHRLGPWVADCFIKPLYAHERMLEPLGITMRPEFVVDDYPHLVEIFGGLVVNPYRRADPGDREMWRVLRAITSSSSSSSAG